MNDLLEMLKGGDRRSIGQAPRVVAKVCENPRLFPLLFEGLLTDDPVVRMRAADAVEKISARRPELLAPFKGELLLRISQCDQKEVRWHVAQLLPRLSLDALEMAAAIRILAEYLKDPSRIVRTFALQALADLAEREPSLRPRAIRELRSAARSGSPAVKSRARKLLASRTR